MVAALLIDIHESYRRDPAYLALLRKSPSALSKLSLRAVRSHLYYKDTTRLYIPNDLALKTRILQECHDAAAAGHLGKDKTVEQVTRRFYWPRMYEEIGQYVSSCDSCQRNKPSNQSVRVLADFRRRSLERWTTSRAACVGACAAGADHEALIEPPRL